jgi:hypothetical protein
MERVCHTFFSVFNTEIHTTFVRNGDIPRCLARLNLVPKNTGSEDGIVRASELPHDHIFTCEEHSF